MRFQSECHLDVNKLKISLGDGITLGMFNDTFDGMLGKFNRLELVISLGTVIGISLGMSDAISVNMSDGISLGMLLGMSDGM